MTHGAPHIEPIRGRAQFKAAGCAGKFAFMSHGLAQMVADRMRRRKKGRIAAYQCEHCHHWHVGGGKRG